MEAVTVVDEYLQNIFNESVNRTLNNIFSSIESINELLGNLESYYTTVIDTYNKVFDFS